MCWFDINSRAGLLAYLLVGGAGGDGDPEDRGSKDMAGEVRKVTVGTRSARGFAFQIFTMLSNSENYFRF